MESRGFCPFGSSALCRLRTPSWGSPCYGKGSCPHTVLFREALREGVGQGLKLVQPPDPSVCLHPLLSLKLGCATFPRGNLAHMDRSVGRLRSMHSKMLMDIEKVQIHFGGSVKASSQMIRELLQAQCLSSPYHKR